jgi:hypothetical protein
MLSPATPVAEFKLCRNSHKLMLKSPGLMEAVLAQREIAQLDVLANREDPCAWLANSLDVSFPSDSEIVKLSLPCRGSDPEECVKVVNAVVKAYQDKFVLEERISQAESRKHLHATIDELDKEVTLQLTGAMEKEAAATTPAEKAAARLLLDECEAAREVRRELKVKELKLEFQNRVNERTEQSSGHTDTGIRVVYSATLEK